jgi:hypothetical protein
MKRKEREMLEDIFRFNQEHYEGEDLVERNMVAAKLAYWMGMDDGVAHRHLRKQFEDLRRAG